ncbi:unnamed protein product [Mytilus coruscus]|uniref:DNA-directed DNA polymerase n=1 Tax=Mytilus coruscus TaxID=42192 RepID=A0A6J8CDT7_MYTCO|nr:unnamed protein product [Mytilus coruscus]
MHKKEHICEEINCKTCKDYYEPGHLCFMMPIQDDKKLSSVADDDTKFKRNKQDKNGNKVYIFFDFECTQDDLVQCEQGYERSDDSLQFHRVCSGCLEQTINSSSTCDTCGKNEIIFSGPNTNEEFCQWLFSGENNGTTVLCHNFKGYDSFPILSYVYRNGILPKIIPSGAKNMSVEVPACNNRMIDSINFLPTALSKLPKMFGLGELQKGYFPHLFNRQENQAAVLENLPDIKYYNPDGKLMIENFSSNGTPQMLITNLIFS